MVRSGGAFHGVRGPKGGRASKARSHASGGVGPTSRCRNARHVDARERSWAAGPPSSATSHRREPAWMPPGPTTWGS
eukprot:1845381-Lingulodinium_polyedra.AAC.1